MWLRVMVVAGFVAACMGVQADERTFVVVGKSHEDINFIEVYAGCQEEARKHGDRCIQGGPSGQAHFRKQNEALRKAIIQQPDGIALSVTKGSFLKENALRRWDSDHAPLITFDSDFERELQHLRQAYVGPSNRLIGKKLAQLLVKTGKSPSELCFMSSDPEDANLKQRIAGARQYLKRNTSWREEPRCPLYNNDAVNAALRQLEYILDKRVASAIISVGAWPVVAAQRYSDVVARAQPEKAPVPILVATGKLRPIDFRLLARRHVTGYVSIDFKAMGREVYRTLRRLAEGQEVPESIETPVTPVSVPHAEPAGDSPAPPQR
ncbi:substrate-binding domain-containing protein [Halomonadaceae bacterium KBTZ08]